MDAFDKIRKQARDKRDAAIQQARAVYRIELAEINSLQKRVNRKPSLKGQPKPAVPMREQIMKVAPTNANFTVQDILDRLGLPPKEKARIRTTFDRLINRGQLKRIRRGRNDVPALFARIEFGPPVNPLNDMSQIKAAETVLREVGPCDLTTLVVAMLDRGYLPASNAATLRKSLQSAFHHSEGRFSLCCGAWSLD